MKSRTAIRLTSLTWLLIGIWLCMKGRVFMADIPHLSIMVGVAAFLGVVKGQVVFKKTAERLARRVLALPAPISLKILYPPSYGILIGCMMLLGILLQFLPLHIRGFIDTAIGVALINGAIHCFRLTYGKTSLFLSPESGTTVQ